MKIAIVGYGVEGKSAYSYWNKPDNQITIFNDQPIEVPSGAKFVQQGSDWQLDDFDLVVRSPGVRPDKLPGGTKTTSVVREFIAKCPAPIIGVTGTKGKGTTSTLIAKMLEADNRTVHLGGNIGVPPLDFLDKVQSTDYVVLELSSFQLMDATDSPQIAVCLMIVPEHMNWHPGMDEYTEAKGNIFRFQQESDRAVYNSANQFSEKLAQLSKGARVPYLKAPGAWVDGEVIRYDQEEICAVSDVALLGRHNLDNVCAAITAVYGIIGRPEPCKQAISGFTGLPHRLELVGEKGSVTYIDDSISTVPETAIAAIRAFDQPKVMILGGADKKSDYTDLVKVIKQSDSIRGVVTLGQMGAKIAEELRATGYDQISDGHSQMADVVTSAAELAQSGDVVLLSPACASFDMFRNYADRGEQFKQAVQKLA